MNFRVIIFFLVFKVTAVSAQVNYLDSAKEYVFTAPQDTATVRWMETQGFAYLYIQPEVSLYLAQAGLLMSEKLGFEEGKSIHLLLLGSAYSAVGSYPKGLETLLKALKRAEDAKDFRGVCAILNSIGICYINLENYRAAANYFLRTLTCFKDLNVDDASAAPENNLSSCYIELKMLDSARIYAQSVYEISQKIKSDAWHSASTQLLGTIYFKMEQYSLATEYYRLSFGLNTLKNPHNKSALIGDALGLAKSFLKTERIDSFLFYSKLAYSTAKNNGFIKEWLECGRILSDYYKPLNTDSAYLYQSVMISAKDSLYSLEKTRMIQELSISESIRQQEIQSDKKNQERTLKANKQYLLLALGIITLIFIFLLSSRSPFVNEKVSKYLGILALLFTFEYVNLNIHNFLGGITHHSPVLMLLTLAVIASILIPLHHKLQHWMVKKLMVKNNKIKLSKAKKIVSSLEANKGQSS